MDVPWTCQWINAVAVAETFVTYSIFIQRKGNFVAIICALQYINIERGGEDYQVTCWNIHRCIANSIFIQGKGNCNVIIWSRSIRERVGSLPQGSDSWWRGLQALLQGMTDCNPPGVLSKRFRTLTIPFPIDSFIIKSRPINLSQRTTKDLLWAEACFVLTDDRCFLLYTPLLACLSISLVKKEYWDNWTYHSDGFSWVWPNFLLNTNILHFEQTMGKVFQGWRHR